MGIGLKYVVGFDGRLIGTNSERFSTYGVGVIRSLVFAKYAFRSKERTAWPNLLPLVFAGSVCFISTMLDIMQTPDNEYPTA